MRNARPFITRDFFTKSHFEFGSGTSLQPLLRFSDRCSDFLFVDFETDPDEVQRHLKRGIVAVENAAQEAGQTSPLTLESLSLHRHLAGSDFELACSPAAVWQQVAELLTPDELRGHAYFAQVARSSGTHQWGLEAELLRRIQHVDGSAETRRLKLRLVGGEGLLTYFAMGGTESPPRSIGTIQTGLGENHRGPVARLFERQAERGAPVPDIWIRGQEGRPRRVHALAWTALQAVPPFHWVGQDFARWRSDRSWPGAKSLIREVKAWIPRQAPLSDYQFGPHRLTPVPLTTASIAAADAVCLPSRLAERLAVATLPHVHVIPRADGALLAPLADTIRSWTATDAFQKATHAVIVPYGYEDELVVVTRWLKSLKQPSVAVHLTRPLDLEAGVRAVTD